MVQIFDSWAGLIPEQKLKNYCIVPNAKIVEFCKKKKMSTFVFQKELKKNMKF